MSNSQALSPLRQSDYEAIEAAVMETEKGRWFLAEYAARHRAANTDEILGAIARLEGLLKRERRPDAERVRLDIGEMKHAIERTKREIAQIRSDGQSPLSRFDRASNELDAIVEQTEAATSEILGAAEKIQEIAFTMREAGVDAGFCDDIENLTTTVYMACSFQDLTGQRTQKVVQVLRYLELRINAMIEIWGMDEDEVAISRSEGGAAEQGDSRPDAHLLNGPALAGEGIEQALVDDLMGEDADADAAALDTVAAHAMKSHDHDRMAALVALEVGSAPPSGEEGAMPPADPLAGMSAKELADSIDFDTIDLDDAVGGEGEVGEAADDGAGAGEPAGDGTAPVSDVELAVADAAVDTAIEALKDVSEAVRGKGRTIADDPFEKMTKIERQALFS